MIGWLAFACAANGPATAPAPPSNPAGEEARVTETITETTVGDLDGVSVPMAQVTTIAGVMMMLKSFFSIIVNVSWVALPNAARSV